MAFLQGTQENMSSLEIRRFRVRPLMPSPVHRMILLPYVIDGDVGIGITCQDALQDLQLVRLVDLFDTTLCLLFAHLTMWVHEPD